MNMPDKLQTAFNISAPTVITPPSPLNLITGIATVSVLTEGTAGQLVVNDCATLAEASVSNQLCAIPFNQLGGPLGFQIKSGLVISQVPTGMVLTVVYTIYVAGKAATKLQTAFNLSGPTVIAPPSPSNPIAEILGLDYITQGSAGNFVINDCATLAEASIENQVCTVAYAPNPNGFVNGGASIGLPIQNGLVISQVPPGGMVFTVTYTIYLPG